jgi:hypothetical protein
MEVQLNRRMGRSLARAGVGEAKDEPRSVSL